MTSSAGRGSPMRRLWALLPGVLILSAWGPSAEARPSAPEIFCETYPDAPECGGRLVTCAQCHTSTYPASWNEFGLALFPGLGDSFDGSLGDALEAIESEDSDGDGISNLEEIEIGTLPGDKLSAWTPPMLDPEGVNPFYKVGQYDQTFAFKRVSLAFCGRSPSYRDLKDFTELDEGDKQDAIHDKLSECLEGRYWTKIVLGGLADKRIRPIHAVGWDSPVGIRLADYEWDYRLFRYAMTGDRDVRDLLLAEYHVESVDGELKKVVEPIQVNFNQGPQPLPLQRRAGMITTQWFLMINTMFSALPRTTAAQAYRAYLGHDISRNEGIRPVEGEPLDVDNKGVTQDECASCHSTLDPLSYAFAYYNGIDDGIGVYSDTRPERYIPGWTDPDSKVLGEKVEDVVAWARVASESDDFKRNVAQMLFELILQRAPEPADNVEFAKLWQGLPDDGYNVNKLLHRLVDTSAFGMP